MSLDPLQTAAEGADPSTPPVSLYVSLTQAHPHDRLLLPPSTRLTAVSIVASMYSGVFGFYGGIRIARLQYLAENAHRLPEKKGGWYFYHKRKNHVCFVRGVETALKNVFKTNLLVVGGFFGTEAALDSVRGIDAFNTIVAGMATGGLYGAWLRLSRGQTLNLVRNGFWLGLVGGAMQDYFLYKRDPSAVWYARYLQKAESAI